jgi:hypothetical protein
MWIALNTGFLSIVTAVPALLPKAEVKRLKDEGAPMCVRARNPEHLAALFPGRKVYQWKGRDYPARIFIGKAALAEFVAQQVLNVDYGNFKSSVGDHPLHDAYMGVWSVMNRYGKGGFDRPLHWNPHSGYQPYQQGLPFNQQVPDDDDDDLDLSGDFVACSTPGCSDSNPCMNCIVDALRDAPLPEPDSYGAFDDREDEGANSHLRVPPR